MNNNHNTCQCRSECKTKRCPCLQEGRACSAECQCQQCKNPYNQIDDPDLLSDCARSHIKKVVSLPALRLDEVYLLPCGCGSMSLKTLLAERICPNCDALHYYSFCHKIVVDSNSMWHCLMCKTCRSMSIWHCKHCNTCTYGLTLSCENCGKKSPYVP